MHPSAADNVGAAVLAHEVQRAQMHLTAVIFNWKELKQIVRYVRLTLHILFVEREKEPRNAK